MLAASRRTWRNLYDRYGTRLVNADTVSLRQDGVAEPGTTGFLVKIEELHLNPDTYILGLWLASSNLVYDSITDAAEFEVVDPPTEAFGSDPEGWKSHL